MNNTQYYQQDTTQKDYESLAVEAGMRLKRRIGDEAYARTIGRMPFHNWREAYLAITAELDRLDGRR